GANRRDIALIAPVPTTTQLKATQNASTGGMLVTLTASIAPSPGDAGTMSFLDNGVAIAGAANVPVNGGVAVFQTSILSPGRHSITAAFSGAAGFMPSVSSPFDLDVAGANPPTAPQILSATPNGNIALLAG